MHQPILSVREIEQKDIDHLIQYWLSADSTFLISMGVALSKLPTREQLTQALSAQIAAPLEEKKAYCIIWLANGNSIGHSNTNPITFGKEACMHLHLWDAKERRRGLGAELVKMTLPYFFENLKLQKLYSEPYAFNAAPNMTLQKVGFELVKEYITTPGTISFEQVVRRWELSYERFKKIKLS